MTLSEMRRLIEVRGLQLTKSLGQNFLHDGNQLRRIVAAAELTPTDRILEIGPGLGPLTELLLVGGGPVLSVEKDARLCAVLRDRWEGNSRFELLEMDALNWLRSAPHDWSGWKLVANLPYSVGSPILVELALNPSPPERMVATLQLEVVQRLAAAPGSAVYGILTLLVGLHYEVAGWFKIPRDCFHPVPEVDSACVTLVRRSIPLLPDEAIPLFARVVKTAFSQRRKMLGKLLRPHWPADRLVAALATAGIAATARAETVSLESFATLTRSLAPPQSSA